MTEMCYYEYAAGIIASVVPGGSIEIAPPSRGVVVDHSGPIEEIFGNAVAHAVAGMSRKEANTIVSALLDSYEDKLNNPPAGTRFQNYFDVVSGTPGKECLELYRKMRREMTDKFGLEMSLTSPYV